MAIDVDTAGSPGWHFKRMAAQLAKRRPRLEVLDAHLRGEPPLPRGVQGMSEELKHFQQLARANYAEMITEAVREREQLLAFRTAAAGDEDGDQQAAAIMAANGLDVESAEVHRTKAALGNSYVIIGDIDDDTGEPTITAEDPRQVITTHDPLVQRRVTSALKMYRDAEFDQDVAYVYRLGDRSESRPRATVHVARKASRRGAAVRGVAPDAWTWDEDLGGVNGQLLPFNRIPVVRFRNMRGVGEYEPHLPHLNRINFWLFQAMVIALHQAHRQRGIKSSQLLEKIDRLKNDPAFAAEMGIDATALETMYRSDPGAMWLLPNDAEMWESAQTALGELGGLIDNDVQRLAAVTRTPLFYMTADAANGSAEGASLSRESLVWKAGDRIARDKQAWRMVMSTAFLFKGDEERANFAALEAIMADPERHSLAEKADAATKYKAAGVPWASTMSGPLQYTPSEIRRMRAERAADFMLEAATQMTEQQAA